MVTVGLWFLWVVLMQTERTHVESEAARLVPELCSMPQSENRKLMSVCVSVNGAAATFVETTEETSEWVTAIGGDQQPKQTHTS